MSGMDAYLSAENSLFTEENSLFARNNSLLCLHRDFVRIYLILYLNLVGYLIENGALARISLLFSLIAGKCGPIHVDVGRDFHHHMDRLVRAIAVLQT